MTKVKVHFGKVETMAGSNYTDIFINDTRIGAMRTEENNKYKLFKIGGNIIEEGIYTCLEELENHVKDVYTEYYDKRPHTVIWFNTWFSSIRMTIEQLREAFPNIRIIGSNKEADCTYSSVADEFFQEPTGLSPEEYVDFALETCAEYGVTIFFPKRYMKTIAKHKDQFETLGVTVVIEDYNTLSKFESKDQVYKILDSIGYDKIPEYSIANNSEDFIEQYTRYTNEGKEVCVKFDKDEGAASFRIVNNKLLSYESMRQKLENTLTYENMLAILRDGEASDIFKPLMVMPKILSPEVSVDCYNSSQLGLIAIPRYKIGNRVKEIILNQELIDDCKRLFEIFRFKSAFNVQYRWTPEGKPKLLEINTRLSGGIHLTTMCGVSIPVQVVADILDVDSGQHLSDIGEVRVTQYETPIIL